MSCIVGFVGHAPASPHLMEGMRQLDHRGHDLAGVALVQGARLLVYKEAGGADRLHEATPDGLEAPCGIGHACRGVRGRVNRAYAQPQVDPTGTVAVVHNGVLDNADALRRRLSLAGARFSGDSDAEVIAHLVARAYAGSPVEAVQGALQFLEGTWGLAVVFAGHARHIVVASKGSPLVVGVGGGATRVASEARALGRDVRQVVRLEDGDIGRLGPSFIELQRPDGRPVRRAANPLGRLFDHLDPLSGHPHALAKEILEQPAALERALRGRVDAHGVHLRPLDDIDLSSVGGLTLLGCGSAFHASQVGAIVAESLTRLPCRAERASAFYARRAVAEADRLFVAVSQRGETQDTLSALRHLQRRGSRTAAIVNTVGSPLDEACERSIHLHSGPGAALVSPQAFTSQVLVIVQLALAMARARHREHPVLEQALTGVPGVVERTLEWTGMGSSGGLRTLAERILESNYAFFMGRGPSAAVAAEGAFTLSGLTAIPCNRFAGGALRFGPSAMIGVGTPVIAVVPADDHRDSMLYSLAEVRGRGAFVAVVHEATDAGVAALADVSLPVPPTHPALAALVSILPLQVLAYQTARLAGCAVDQDGAGQRLRTVA